MIYPTARSVGVAVKLEIAGYVVRVKIEDAQKFEAQLHQAIKESLRSHVKLHHNDQKTWEGRLR